MKFVLFYHSLVSDWNHGNAHFLRGVVKELARRNHEVTVLEPNNGWSRENLLKDHGRKSANAIEKSLGLNGFFQTYDPLKFDPAPWVESADVVLVHEWNDPSLVSRIGACRRLNGRSRMYFHDTHHRAVSAPEEMRRYELDEYDGALVFGKSLKYEYARHGWTDNIWVWHEAADTSWFYPRARPERKLGDIVWIGNWGDGERAAELETYLFGPVEELGLNGRIHGVRYPADAIERLERAGLSYAGWLPNHNAPDVFAGFDFTVHVPRRFYTEALPGIPTIRVFEALACGIPLICAPWEDSERLFKAGSDYLGVESRGEMIEAMRELRRDEALADRLRSHGLDTIRNRHTCAHRVDELLSICRREVPHVELLEDIGRKEISLTQYDA